MNYDFMNEVIEKTGNVELSKEMMPEQKEWEKLGFIFSDIEGDNVLCNATLPEGWVIHQSSACNAKILDEHKRERGYFTYKPIFYDRDAFMCLERRYGVFRYYLENDHTMLEVWFGTRTEKIFVAGQVKDYEQTNGEESKFLYKEYRKLFDLAEKYANENYPDWNNPLAYWDNQKDISHSIIKR